MVGIIFDFNGTLFFDNDKHVLAWGAISREIRQKDITLEELATKLNGVPNQKIITYFFGHEVAKETIHQYSLKKEEYYRHFCKEHQPSFHLVDGATDLFDTLKAKQIPMTICSASIIENINFFFESFHLNNWFNQEQVVYDNGTYDNKIAMFKDAAMQINVPIENCIVFEDSFSGIKNAYSAGVQKIIVIAKKDEFEKYQSLPGVIHVMEDFKDFDIENYI